MLWFTRLSDASAIAESKIFITQLTQYWILLSGLTWYIPLSKTGNSIEGLWNRRDDNLVSPVRHPFGIIYKTVRHMCVESRGEFGIKI